MGRSETAAKVGIALKDTIGEKVGIDFAKQRSQVRMAGGEIRSSFHILNHLGVDQNARGCLMALHPRRDQRNSSRTGKEQCSQRRRVEQIAPHSSIGGVGLLSWRIRSSASTISSQSISLHPPITPILPIHAAFRRPK